MAPKASRDRRAVLGSAFADWFRRAKAEKAESMVSEVFDRCVEAPLKALLFVAAPLLVALAGCTTVPISTAYEDVPGVTVEQVLTELSRRSSSEIGDIKVSMTPHVWLEEVQSECRVSRADVKYDVEVVLPRYSGSSRMDADSRALLRALSGLFKEIARAMRDITKFHAKELELELKDLPPRPTCERLKADMKRTVERGYRANSRELDRFEAEMLAEIEKAFES